MKSRFLLLIFLFNAICGFAQNFNPILPDNIADPSVAKFDGVYYLYGTTDIDKGLSQMGPPVVWKSTDFVNWSFKGTLMSGIDWDKPHKYTDEKGEERTGYFRYWAPGAPVKKGNLYYLFPTIVKPDGWNGTYTMISESPEGPFRFQNGDGVFYKNTDPNIKETLPLVDDIDGEVFADENGKTYFYWRRRFASEIKNDYSELIGERISILTSKGGYSEGPTMFKANGFYYYIYTLRANQNYCNAYMMSSESPVSGFKKPETGNDIFLFSSIENGVWGPGHGNVFYDADADKYIFLYLEYGEGSTTRQVFANEILFDSNGTIRTITPDFKGVGYIGKKTKEKKNLALKAIATASSYKSDKTKTVKIETQPNEPVAGSEKEVSRTHTYKPENAIDNSNGTRWIADENDVESWYMLDFGKKTKISSCEMFFNFPALGHKWTLEKSDDGKNWTICEHSTNDMEIQTPYIAKNNGKTRYLRIKIHCGSAGLWEIKVY
jgi:Beta-xylosidase